MPQQTPLNSAHRSAGAKMIDFGGWDLPISYGSQLEEHHEVRTGAGMFDVSHMTAIDVQGARAREFLSRLLANNVARIARPGQALYSCMLNAQGGVVDDLIAYGIEDNEFRLVVNAATTQKDLDWIEAVAEGMNLGIRSRRDLAMLAVQGPQARDRVLEVLPDAVRAQAASLPRFFAMRHGDDFIARTGYTGEDGFEVSVPDEQVETLWGRLLDAGVRPCGLGARDTLRLEAGMHLYGQDIDENTSPLEAGLAWTVDLASGREFIGRDALEQQLRDGLRQRFTGVLLEGRGVLRPGQQLVTGRGNGILTSGSFSPTLQRAIGLARVPVDVQGGVQVDMRGKLLELRLVKPPFVRLGTPRIEGF